MKLNRCNPAHLRVTEVALAVFFTLSVPVAVARIVDSRGQSSGGVCEDIYRRYNEDHILCRQPESACQPVASGVEGADKDIILAAHNRYRSQIATGNNSSFPHASNMLEMEWDDDLARVAQAHANLCSNQPSCSSCMRIEKFPHVGRTGCLIRTDSENNTADWEGCIGYMYKESLRIPTTSSNTPLRTMRGVESFTQLAWATTWKVGCGYVKYPSGSALRFEKLYTCAYGPGGNVRGEEVYKVGPACTDCPEGTCCGESCQQYNITPSYSGLCKVVDDGPIFPLDDEDNLLFRCLFNKATSQSCNFQSDPSDGWKTKTFFASTGHAESVLEAGQSAEMTFEQPIKSSHGRLCIEVEYNKGPNVAGTLDRGLFELLVTPVVRPQRQRTINLSGGAINTMRMRITLHYNFDVKIGFSFIVPRGSPAQYVNIHKVLIYEKACPERYRHALD
ncbi:CRISP/Allergen/PR-1 isoform X3 [Rhipicephalus sanguineus]|uniref:CRISP/Allergen/PR-1 isoform X3 n=1 Tax=Rhipicephalus sanguineus TaxID=34632 RepID=UPI0020C3E35B|nr:CRISP/Allergen/PR-1 isoform X3 [Rhipicephalus sanguineus]